MRKDPVKSKLLKRKTRLCSTEAALISIVIHLVLLISAGSIVAVRWLNKPEAAFEGDNAPRPKLERPKLQMPVKVKKLQRKNRRPNVKTRMSTQKTRASYFLPDRSKLDGLDNDGVDREDTDLESLGRNVGMGFKMPEFNFFGLTASGEKVVFMLHAGPATTTKTKGRAFQTIKKEMRKMVGLMPRSVLMYPIVYWGGNTTPMETKMFLATKENKQRFNEWIGPLNTGSKTGGQTYGSGFSKKFSQKLKDLKRDEKLSAGQPAYAPAWMYDYRCNKEVRAFFPAGASSKRKEFINWARAMTCAIKQTPDTIFLLCTDYIIHDVDENALARSFQAMVNHYYEGRRPPTINVVLMTNKKDNKSIDKFKTITRAFDGKFRVINEFIRIEDGQ
ncbi:MAG: hypothetical protein K9M45_09260 [Kiritimatiellales bacterium]|nr:hypothetical protein [Kiritimatiellales bacterium]